MGACQRGGGHSNEGHRGPILLPLQGAKGRHQCFYFRRFLGWYVFGPVVAGFVEPLSSIFDGKLFDCEAFRHLRSTVPEKGFCDHPKSETDTLVCTWHARVAQEYVSTRLSSAL